MDFQLAASEDTLIDSLAFDLPSSANYILERRSSTVFPNSSGLYGPGNARMLKFNITGQDWLDPSTLRIQYRLTNDDATNKLHLINALPVLPFRRLRILCGGQLISDCDYYSRV